MLLGVFCICVAIACLAFLPFNHPDSGNANMIGAAFLIIGVPLAVIFGIAFGVSLLIGKIFKKPGQAKRARIIAAIVFAIMLALLVALQISISTTAP